MATNYDLKKAIPNKLLNPDGSLTDWSGNPVENVVEEYRLRPALPNKFLNPDGSYSTLQDVLPHVDTELFIIVEELPEEGIPNKIYLVPAKDGQFDEYFWNTNNQWDKIGTIDNIGLVVMASQNTTVNGYQVPKLNAEQITQAYNALVAGKSVTITDASDKMHFSVDQADTIDEIKIVLNYFDVMTLTYNLDGTIDYLEIVSKDYVDEKILEVEMFKFPNVTIVGTPTITHGQISDFSMEDYLEFPFLVDFRGRPFTIDFAFTTGTDIINQQNILDSDYGLAFAIRDRHLVMAVSFNGTSWATEQTGTFTLETQTTYRIKISWNGLSYKVQYSIDGGKTYLDDISFGNNQYPSPKQMFIGVGKLANNFFKGIINLNFAEVRINGELIWQGMDDVGLATRLATDLSNIDQAGITRITDIIKDNVEPQFIYWDGVKTNYAPWNKMLKCTSPVIMSYSSIYLCVINNPQSLKVGDRLQFSKPVAVSSTSGSDKSGLNVEYWTVTITGMDANRNITALYPSYTNQQVNYLDTNKDYSTPFTPTKDGHPATKKYVDDSIKNNVTDVLGGEY